MTKIKVFGDDGEIYIGKFKHEGATAELVFDQVDLQLETIMGGEEWTLVSQLSNISLKH